MVRLELLGGFRVTIGTLVIPDDMWRTRKAAALIKLLCLAPRHRLRREQITNVLWPDLPPQAAAANLRKTVHFIRQMYSGRYETQPVLSQGDMLTLPVDHIWVDVVEFRSTLARAREARDLQAYADAIELYRNGLLPEDGDEWTEAPRVDLRNDYVSILDEYAVILESAGLLEESARVTRLLIAADPLLEDAHVRLMRVLALAGRRAEALRQFDVLRDLLDGELGIEPGPEAQRLHEEVRARKVPEPQHTSVLWQRIGDLRMGSGDATGAIAAYEAALELSTSRPETARLHRLTAAAYLGKHRPDPADHHLVRAESATVDPAERARLVCLRAEQAWLRGDLETALLKAAEARELATAHGTFDDVARAEEAMAIVTHMRGDWRRGLEIELSRTGDGLGAETFSRAFDIHQCIGQFHLYSDELSRDVEQYARQTLSRATNAGIVRAQAFAWCLLGESLLLRARWDEAGGCLQQSADLHATLGSASGALPWQRLAELAACQRLFDEVGPALRRASAIATVSPMARHQWGRIHATAAFARLQRGEPDRAAQSIRAAAAAAARYGDCLTCGALLHPVAAEAYAALGDAERARAHAVSAADTADAFGGSAWRAMAESAAGSAASAEGDPDSARIRFATAADLYTRVGHAYWAERSRQQADAATSATEVRAP
ncbi:BTAD domain-containing putative transcriptional regulator [Nonomuraea sp. NPDC049269]|uniref:BTAD domain-containing putative transcriptional regulator n=1 Tax=Nonomuraea sp. NPDC049269 TaxID=3364349 RepID=UPI00372310D5